MATPEPTPPVEERCEPSHEADLLALFQFAIEMLCIASRDGYFKRVNPAFEITLGYSEHELLSRPFLDFVHPDDQEKTKRELEKLAQGFPSIRFENRYRCQDGTHRWLSWMAMPQEDGNRIYAVASDVTHQKRVEAALRESEERCRQLLEAVTSYTYSVELQDGVPCSTSHSMGCLATTGYTAGDFATDPFLWITMVHLQDRGLVLRHAENIRAAGENGPIEHRILHRDGSVRWVRHKIVSHHDDQGRLVRYDGLIEDITERKLSEERFRLLVESAPDAMVVVDRHGEIVLVNSQAELLFGYSQNELLGQTVEMLVPHALRARHVTDRKAHTENARPRMMGKHAELSGLRNDGSEFPAEIALSPIGTARGTLIYAAVRDLTERNQAEKILHENLLQFMAAQRIQEHLLPDHPPVLPGFDIAGASYPAEFAAGDHFDFLPMPDQCLGIVVADVAGHGIAPAILMASFHAHLHSLAAACSEVGEILGRANGIVISETDSDRFVTALLMRLDPQTRTLVYASAGHPTGYILDERGRVKATLPSTSFPLGIVREAQFPCGAPLTLQPGDILLLFTDGLTEAMSESQGPFGCERALQVVARNRERSAREILAALYRAVTEFCGGEKLSDDVTVVVIRTF